MNIEYLGHSTFVFEEDNTKFITDPFISGNEDADVDVDSISVDYVFVSHAHQDHILDVEQIAEDNGATIIANFEICNYFEEKGLEVHPLNHGGRFSFELGKTKMVNAIHSSSFPDGSYGGHPSGFLFELNGRTVYFAGDTSVMSDMALFGDLYDIDIAMLPIGGTFTMDPSDAVRASDMVDVDQVIGMHYDTFPPIEIDHRKAKAVFSQKGKELTLLSIGEAIQL